jgi:hypothetical protein
VLCAGETSVSPSHYWRVFPQHFFLIEVDGCKIAVENDVIIPRREQEGLFTILFIG